MLFCHVQVSEIPFPLLTSAHPSKTSSCVPKGLFWSPPVARVHQVKSGGDIFCNVSFAWPWSKICRPRVILLFSIFSGKAWCNSSRIKLLVIELPSWSPSGPTDWWTQGRKSICFVFVCLLDCFPLVHLPPDHGLPGLCLWPKSINFGHNYFLPNAWPSASDILPCNLVLINNAHQGWNIFSYAILWSKQRVHIFTGLNLVSTDFKYFFLR